MEEILSWIELALCRVSRRAFVLTATELWVT